MLSLVLLFTAVLARKQGILIPRDVLRGVPIGASCVSNYVSPMDAPIRRSTTIRHYVQIMKHTCPEVAGMLLGLQKGLKYRMDLKRLVE